MLSRRDLIGLPVAAAIPLVGLAAACRPGAAAASPAEFGAPNPRVFRLFDGDDGLTHFERTAFETSVGGVRGAKVVPDAPGRRPGFAAPLVLNLFHANAEINLVANAPGERTDHFHHGDRLELMYFIGGHWEFGTRDGKILKISPGDFLWAADNSGKGGGHTTRVVGPEWGLAFAAFV